MSTSAKKLKYNSLKELNNQINIVKSASPAALVKSAPKVIAAAEDAEKQCDEELAYIFYMKFVQLSSQVRRTKDYRDDKKYYDAMLTNAMVKNALERAEALGNNLEKRYDMANLKIEPRENGSARKITPPPVKNNDVATPVKPANTMTNGVANSDPDVIYMEPTGLLNLMKEKSTSFFVMDVRDSTDFKSSHVQHVNVLNIPGEILTPGVTAKSIERKLHIELRSQWTRRGSVDKLILMDWTSESVPKNSDGNCKLSILKDALLKWDTDSSKCQRPLYVIKGGFENFGLQYPMFTTNPKKVMAPLKNSGIASVDKLLSFNNIEYPDLDTGFIGSPSPASSANTSIEAAPISNGPLYPSTSEMTKNVAIMSGAITVSRTPQINNQVHNNYHPASFRPPLLPDRSTKPLISTPKVNEPVKPIEDDQDAFNVTKLSDSLSSTIASTASEMNNAMMESDTSNVTSSGFFSYNVTSSEYESIPNVDRSLKAKALLRMSELTKKKMSDVLEAEKDLIEDTLQLERKQLEMENRWEVFRLRREKSAEEDMKLEVMKKEEALLEELARLNEEKMKKDEENEKLRQQLTAMKVKMEQESDLRHKMETEKEQQRIGEAKNAQLEAERLRLQREVEQKRKLRVQKQREREKAIEMEQTQARIEEAERKRREIDRELKEKERLRQIRENNINNRINSNANTNSNVNTNRINSNDNVNTNSNVNIIKVGLKKDSSEEEGTKSSLNRSHSSPNIAQMLDDENVYTKNVLSQNNLNNKMSIPEFSRTNKPASITEISQARRRDFQPIWGTNTKGLTGLRNLGNTCYMNSILQCLSNFTFLSKYFVEKSYAGSINEKSQTKGEIAIEFSEVVAALWSGQYKSISPVDFKRAIGKFKESFRSHDQQDAHELLVYLMEWLHNDINEVKIKVTLPEQKNDGLPDIEAAKTAWEMESKADRSFIRELFYGQWKSSLTCDSCGWASVKYESFFELALHLPAGNTGRSTLDQCIQNCLKPEIVPYTCPKCNRMRDCRKKFDIVKLPLILTVQLVRFYNHSDGLLRKKQNFIDFELNKMDFGKYATACDGKLNRYRNYDLFAVCNHFGSMEGGHYTAYCLSQRFNKWFKYDDQEVTEMNPRDVVTSAAYVLFYTTRNK